jgi:hypothetical protein
VLLVQEVAVANTTARAPAIHIGQTAPDGQVVVHSGDDKFLLTVQEAVNACGMWNKMAQFQLQMKALMDRLSHWVEERKATVRDAYLTVKTGGGLFFMVVMAHKKYDPALEDELTALDIEVANSPDYDLLRMSVLAIPDTPPECVESFLTNC